ncbi:hypothetical protein OIU77_028030 [Salix suchowensis]|uniref:Uncharacterized protein n=1 Tax=Salix suchowensis TaxID=1278906 RepID=A0ABQ9BTB7_9ROSI|nr:hypothetical protein OIU77_028030 [Salix suchowensis]
MAKPPPEIPQAPEGNIPTIPLQPNPESHNLPTQTSSQPLDTTRDTTHIPKHILPLVPTPQRTPSQQPPNHPPKKTLTTTTKSSAASAQQRAKTQIAASNPPAESSQQRDKTITKQTLNKPPPPPLEAYPKTNLVADNTRGPSPPLQQHKTNTHDKTLATTAGKELAAVTTSTPPVSSQTAADTNPTKDNPPTLTKPTPQEVEIPWLHNPLPKCTVSRMDSLHSQSQSMDSGSSSTMMSRNEAEDVGVHDNWILEHDESPPPSPKTVRKKKGGKRGKVPKGY